MTPGPTMGSPAQALSPASGLRKAIKHLEQTRRLPDQCKVWRWSLGTMAARTGSRELGGIFGPRNCREGLSDRLEPLKGTIEALLPGGGVFGLTLAPFGVAKFCKNTVGDMIGNHVPNDGLLLRRWQCSGECAVGLDLEKADCLRIVGRPKHACEEVAPKPVPSAPMVCPTTMEYCAEPTEGGSGVGMETISRSGRGMGILAVHACGLQGDTDLMPVNSPAKLVWGRVAGASIPMAA
jgi:hypothetical protein